MIQIDMFGTCPHCNGAGIVDFTNLPSRKSDPETSKVAGSRHEGDARRFSSKSNQGKLLKLFSSKPMTAQEAALSVIGFHSPISALESCRRRVSDLRKAGYIADSGERRKNSGSPDESIIWRITLSGVSALENLNTTGWSFQLVSEM